MSSGLFAAPGADRPAGRCNSRSSSAIQLSMIVVITSWAPVVAFRKPAIPAQIAPAAAAPTTASRMCGGLVMLTKEMPIQLAT
mgnify:CR=1 FL=1